MMWSSLHVVIVGGGVIGMFSAYYLIRNGFSVTIIDKNLENEKTSINNAGLIVPSFASTPPIGVGTILSTYLGRQGPVYISPSELFHNLGWLLEARRTIRTSDKVLIEFGMKSLQLYQSFFLQERLNVDLVKGVVGLYKDAASARKVAQDLKGRFIDSTAIQEIGYAGLEGGVMFEDELSVNPARLFIELRKRLTELGVQMILGKQARLQGARPKVNSAVIDGMRLPGDVFVVAAGAWSKEVCKPLGYSPPIIPARGLTMVFETGSVKLAGRPTLLEDYGVPVVQHNQDTLRVTGFFELRGFERKYAQSRKNWLMGIINRHLMSARTLKCVSEGVGFRPCTPDQLPLIGKVPGYQNLIIASGHSRLGVTLAAATGSVIEELVAGKGSDSDLRHFDPARFL
jgi:D-amino-acid dehydrogenase